MSGILRRLALLERRTLREVSRFRDYNFRNYFQEHTRDTFLATRQQMVLAASTTAAGSGAAIEAVAAAKLQRRTVLKQLRLKLKQMKRMAVVNRMYTKQRVVVDAPRSGL